MFVLRSTYFQALCLVYTQIYMPMCSLPCLFLDLHVYAQIYVFMFRFICLCASCHVCVLKSICWLLMPCASIALLSFDISLSCVLALIGGVQIQILWSRPTLVRLGLYQRVWIISFMHVYVCLLASILYVNVCLSRSRPCQALHPSWACACWSLGPIAYVVASIPPRACLDVSICEIHLCGVGVLDTHLFPPHAMLLTVLTLCHLFGFLYFYAFLLHACLHVHAWVFTYLCRLYSNLMEVWTLDPNLHMSSQGTFFCLITCCLPFSHAQHALFASVRLYLLVCSLHALPISLVFSFACLLTCFFCLCMYTHGALALGARVQPPRLK